MASLRVLSPSRPRSNSASSVEVMSGDSGDEATSTSAAPDGLTTGELQKIASSRSPPRLALLDLWLLWKNRRYVLDVVLPLKWPRSLPGVKINDRILLRDYSLVVIIGLIQTPIILFTLPVSLIVLPGWASVVALLLAVLLLTGLARLTWAPQLIAHSDAGILTDEQKAATTKERWVYVNGIATSYSMLQLSIDLLSSTFKRPVFGVHNRSFGVVADLVECIVQRSFNYETEDVRVARAAVTAMLRSPGVERVVLLAHSQGGIVVSMLLDRLYSTVEREHIRKLEVYTFGSAAAYFHNPALASSSQPSSPVDLKKPLSLVSAEQRQSRARAVSVIEHYVNQYDLVPRWGVLYHVLIPQPVTVPSYSGRVFVHDKATGHLFDQHYLEAMFPLWKLGSDDPHVFWNHRVRLDKTLGSGVLRSATFPKPPPTVDIVPATPVVASAVEKTNSAIEKAEEEAAADLDKDDGDDDDTVDTLQPSTDQDSYPAADKNHGAPRTATTQTNKRAKVARKSVKIVSNSDEHKGQDRKKSWVSAVQGEIDQALDAVRSMSHNLVLSSASKDVADKDERSVRVRDVSRLFSYLNGGNLL